jgi:hypothetical protein
MQKERQVLHDDSQHLSKKEKFTVSRSKKVGRQSYWLSRNVLLQISIDKFVYVPVPVTARPKA